MWKKTAGRGAGGGMWLADRSFRPIMANRPNVLYALLDSDDSAASQRAFAAMLKMKKLDLAALEQAYKQA